jgi:hypothetical protein
MYQNLGKYELENGEPVTILRSKYPFVNEHRDLAYGEWGQKGNTIYLSKRGDSDPLAAEAVDQNFLYHEIEEVTDKGRSPHEDVHIRAIKGKEGSFPHMAWAAILDIKSKIGGNVAEIYKKVNDKYPLKEWIELYRPTNIFNRIQRYVIDTYVESDTDYHSVLGKVGKYLKKGLFPESDDLGLGMQPSYVTKGIKRR